MSDQPVRSRGVPTFSVTGGSPISGTTGTFTSYIAVGSAPALGGGVRMTNNTWIEFLVAAGGADVAALQVSSTDNTCVNAITGKSILLQNNFVKVAQVDSAGLTMNTGKPVILSTSGWVQHGRAATASRPSAATAGAGAEFYDTTLSKPIWSDGTVWRDATGTAV